MIYDAAYSYHPRNDNKALEDFQLLVRDLDPTKNEACM